MDLDTDFEIIDDDIEEDTVLISKQEYTALKKKVEEAQVLYDKFLRLQAEFENYKKFMERQKTNYLKFGNEKLLKEVIKIYDDLKRALKGHDDSELTHGLKLILENFSALLKCEGIAPIEAEGGEFNPEIHDCMMVEQDPSLPDGVITEIFEDGYYLNGKVLRPSKVKVNKKIGDEM
ncbi:MAG: nucleotide exchange factor GrpE [Candidatus Helarchaeota archaeon]|nr:nucleotide exchange factor GrpE [Candidatus Helarchaeota archaeon]